MMAKSKRTKDAWTGVAHVRIRLDVINSPAWRVLSFSAKALYADLRAKVRQTNNGNISATLSEMKHHGWASSATLASALNQLQVLGFLAKTRQGGIAAMSKVCSLYRFTDLEVWEHPKLGIEAQAATYDYRQYESVTSAKAAIRESRKKKSKVQKLKLVDIKNEAITPKEASKNEQEGPTKHQNLNK